jgi:hypothetical protein
VPLRVSAVGADQHLQPSPTRESFLLNRIIRKVEVTEAVIIDGIFAVVEIWEWHGIRIKFPHSLIFQTPGFLTRTLSYKAPGVLQFLVAEDEG